MRKSIMYTIVCALVFQFGVLFADSNGYANAQSVHVVDYEEYISMGFHTDKEDCYERAHDGRRARPSGTLGGMIYDYSQLPDPSEMIFVCMNNQFLDMDVPVEVEKGSSLIPMRALLENLGATVIWDESTETVTAMLNGKEIKMTVDRPLAVVNGKTVPMTVPARKHHQRVYIPLRFVSDQLDRSVIWQPDNRIIKVYSYPELAVQPIHTTVEVRTDDYRYTNYFSITDRYLLRQNGEIHWLQQWGGDLHIQILDESFRKKDEVILSRELEMFGGAHAGEDGNFYLVFAQDNAEESDFKTIYRIVKYDPDWNKLDQADVSDVHVTKPLDASNLTMDSHHGKLVIYSARERYLAADGLNHQSNIPIHIRMEDMSILYDGGQWPRNHVSHSFATFVKFDGDRIIYLDHGDAFPRSIVLQVEEAEHMTGAYHILTFPGEIGDNYTGAKAGGLEVAANHYLTVGSYIRPGETTSQLFLAAVPKNAESSDDVQLSYLTDSSDPSVSETHLVKVNDDRFVIIWSDSGSMHNVNYVVTDGSGKLIGESKRLEGVAPPGQIDPLVLNGKIVWYYQEFIYSKEDMSEFYVLTIE